jgi:hypothetical protein
MLDKYALLCAIEDEAVQAPAGGARPDSTIHPPKEGWSSDIRPPTLETRPSATAPERSILAGLRHPPI